MGRAAGDCLHEPSQINRRSLSLPYSYLWNCGETANTLHVVAIAAP